MFYSEQNLIEGIQSANKEIRDKGAAKADGSAWETLTTDFRPQMTLLSGLNCHPNMLYRLPSLLRKLRCSLLCIEITHF